MRVNWRWLSISAMRSTGMVDAQWRSRWMTVRLMRRCPVDNVSVKVTDITPKGAIVGIEASASAITFVRKTNYTLRFIAHPNGRCGCTEFIGDTESWINLSDDRVALFYPFKGYSASKSCRVCHGTGARPECGNAMQIVCDSCGAGYPFRWDMQRINPCAMCAVDRESGVRVSMNVSGGNWQWRKVWKV